MSQEITMAIKVEVAKGTYLKDKFDPGTQRFDMSGELRAGGTIDVTTSEKVLDFGEVTSPGLLMLQNIGAVDVQYGPESGGAMVLLGLAKPGRPYVIDVGSGSVVIRVKTATSTSKLDYKLWSA